MDALIKSIRPGKPSDAKSPETRPAELDPAEFLAAAVRADQPRPTRAEAEAAVLTLLGYIGENPVREGLLDTPRRVVEAFDELYQGYHLCPSEVLDRTFGETAGYDDFVLIRDIEFTSQCEHHMMPFYGKAHIAYTPVERVVGLSKLARLTDIFARRLQTRMNARRIGRIGDHEIEHVFVRRFVIALRERGFEFGDAQHRTLRACFLFGRLRQQQRLQIDIEHAGGVLRALHVAGHPEKVIGGAA